MDCQDDGRCQPTSTAAARKILIGAAERCVQWKSDRTTATSLGQMAHQELRSNLGSVSAVLLLLLGYALSKDRRVTTLALAILALCSLLTGVLIKVLSRRCEIFELQDRVTAACEEFKRGSLDAETSVAGSGATAFRQSWGPSVGLEQGSALASVISVYRDSFWQRVPKLLLVKGDIVALMAGDVAPCRVKLLRIKEGEREDQEKEGSEGVTRATGPDAPSHSRQALPVAFSNAIFYNTGTQISAGQYIGLRPEAGEHLNKTALVSASSPELLLLCGDMRCYYLVETPLEAHLKMSLSPSSACRRDSLLRERIRAAGRRCYSTVFIAAIVAAAAGGIRLVLADGSRGGWALFLLVIPGQVAVCLLPLSLPIYLALGEAVATARLLAFLELMLGRKRETKKTGDSSPAAGEYDEFDQMDAEEREEANSGTSHTVSWRKARAYLSAVVTARWDCGMRSREHPSGLESSPLTPMPTELAGQNLCDKKVGLDQNLRTPSEPCPMKRYKLPRPPKATIDSFVVSEGPSNGAEYNGNDIVIDGDTKCDAKFSRTRVGLVSSFWYNCLTSTQRRILKQLGQDRAKVHQIYGGITTKEELRHQTMLPVPMLKSGLVERLGAVTTLCMLDEDTVCKPTAAVKEVFIIDAKDDAGSGSGTVLDMHTQQGKKGVRFEDPQWWTHLPSLKPIGLTCLLAEAKLTERTQARGKLMSSSAPNGRPSASGQRFRKHSSPGQALLDHVRESHPMEHLTDLWKAIGFSLEDRATFREKRRVHVINPRLTAARATEDTHAQGQDESRRRGTVQPHLTAVIAQDRRSDTLQLLSQGHPSIVLGMCRDYWDGSAISNLPQNLGKTILDMHQQWSLEDLDVVAFAYTPVPQTVNPCLSSFSKYPDYLIHPNQQATKGRSRGVTGTHSLASSKHSTGPSLTRIEVAEHGGLDASNDKRRNRQEANSKLSGDALRQNMGLHNERPREYPTFFSQGSADQVLLRDPSQDDFGQAMANETHLDETFARAGDKAEFGETHQSVSAGNLQRCVDEASTRGKSGRRENSSNMASGTHFGVLHSNEEDSVTARVEANHSSFKKAVKFKGDRSNNSPTVQHIKMNALRRPSALNGGGGSSINARIPADSKNGGRRYSVDDCGVTVARRSESRRAQETVTGDSEEAKMAEGLWSLMHEQVFLGMAASFVPPKRDVVALIEDVEAAGVRFVYFSPRNMRRSKALAESMGIETDWNCAISLRPLEDSTQPDPHRMKSDYADWDVKARLPHGIASIREHIENVDNVPLLVSLFTDATPRTTEEMIDIYHEYYESVLAVGMSHRVVNAELFRAADLSLSVEGLPLNQPLSSLPVASKSCFSAIDAAFNSKLVGIHAALPLGDMMRSGGAIGGLDEVGSVIIDLVREGRRLLTNSYQALAFLLLASFTVALLVLFATALPISHPMTLGGDHLIWILWVVAPLLATSFLASPADGSLMRRTPEKNDPNVVPIAPRLVMHLLLRTIPTVLVCLGLYVYLMGAFLLSYYPELAATCAGQAEQARATWIDMIWCRALEDADSGKIRTAAQQAVDLVLVELVLCLTAQSAGCMYRTASIRKEHPWKNWVWVYVIIFIFFLQVLYLWASAAARQTLGLLSSCPWEPLVVGAVCPLLTLLLGELVKRNDARGYDRYVTLLRLEFDTRLGMHSPR